MSPTLHINANSTGDDAIGTGGTAVAIPTTSAGRKPKRVLLTCSGGPVHYRPAISGQTFTAAQCPVLTPEGGGVTLWVQSFTHVYFITAAGTALVRVTPLDG